MNRKRVKDRIARLEQELEEKKGQIDSSRVYQELLRRNRFLEEEVAKLKKSLGAPVSSAGSSAGSLSENNGFSEPQIKAKPSETCKLAGDLKQSMNSVYTIQEIPQPSITPTLSNDGSPTGYRTSSEYTAGTPTRGVGQYSNLVNCSTSTSDLQASGFTSSPVHGGMDTGQPFGTNSGASNFGEPYAQLLRQSQLPAAIWSHPSLESNMGYHQQAESHLPATSFESPALYNGSSWNCQE